MSRLLYSDTVITLVSKLPYAKLKMSKTKYSRMILTGFSGMGFACMKENENTFYMMIDVKDSIIQSSCMYSCS